MPLILPTWKSKLTWSPGLALAPYVMFRWVGVTHSIFRSSSHSGERTPTLRRRL